MAKFVSQTDKKVFRVYLKVPYNASIAEGTCFLHEEMIKMGISLGTFHVTEYYMVSSAKRTGDCRSMEVEFDNEEDASFAILKLGTQIY